MNVPIISLAAQGNFWALVVLRLTVSNNHQLTCSIVLLPMKPKRDAEPEPLELVASGMAVSFPQSCAVCMSWRVWWEVLVLINIVNVFNLGAKQTLLCIYPQYPAHDQELKAYHLHLEHYLLEISYKSKGQMNCLALLSDLPLF